MNSSEIKVSVMMVTYNHEKYIEQAILSVLNQNVDFRYELLIGEDCSTDHTRAVAEKYQVMYPEVIKLIKHNKNMGALKNEADLRRRCQGQYIAVLEGDDYWTNPDKLKRQVEFLDTHLHYIGTAHNVTILDRHGKKLPYDLEGIFHHQREHVYTKKDALNLDLIGHLSGWMYRNIWKQMSQKEFNLIKRCNVNSDVKLSIVLGIKGDIFFAEDEWSVYRKRYKGDGWTATHSNRNLQLYLYENDVELRNLLERCYGEQIDIKARLLQYVGESLRKVIRNPSKENIQIFIKLFCKKDLSKREIMYYLFRKQYGGILSGT